MGTIYKRTGDNQRKSQKNWVAQTRIHGRTRSRSFHEKAEAKSWLAQTEGRAVLAENAPALAQRGARAELPHLFIVGHALDLYSTAAPRHVSTLTWKACQAPIVAYWRKQPLARRSISDVFRNDIKEWITKSRAAGCPAGTIRKRLNILKQAIDLGLERTQSSRRNPAAGHRIKRDPKRRRRPTPAEKCALYSAAQEARRALAYWAMRWAEECGMRRAEIARLRHQDINFENEPPILTVPLAKTQPRRFYMWPQLVRLYEEVSTDLGCTEYVFGGIRADSITQAFERIRRKSKISNEVTFHSFRYEANSWMVEKRVPRKLRKQIIGHVSDEMSDHYTEFSEVAAQIMSDASEARG
ncbi:tyrosine-type recombinase/integrase [Salinisphaera dokdonensis]